MLSLTTPLEVAQTLASRVRERRLEQGWTQAELAERAGLRLATYVLFERTGRIALVRLARVLEALGRLDDLNRVAAAAPLAGAPLDRLLGPKKQRGRRRPTP